MRDSAGIEIVENGATGDRESDWQVNAAPSVIIGTADGLPQYELSDVRGATRTASGGIAIANSGTDEVRFYDGKGEHILSVGGTGEGPGEFQQLAGLWPYRTDSLITWDHRLRRATVYSQGGGLGRQITAQVSAANPLQLRPLGPEQFLLENSTYDFGGSKLRQQTMELILLGATGAVQKSLGTYASQKSIRIEVGGMPYIAAPIFGSHASLSAFDTLLYVGEASHPRVDVWTSSGHLSRIIRWTTEDRRVEQADIDAFIAERLESESDDDMRRRRREIFEKSPVESDFPAYDRFLVDRTGYIWVKSFRRPRDTGAQRWMVIDRDGRMCGNVLLPEGLQPLEIGEDYVLGVQLDELGVTSVRLHQLLR